MYKTRILFYRRILGGVVRGGKEMVEIKNRIVEIKNSIHEVEDKLEEVFQK